MSNYNTSAADYKLMNYHNNNNNSGKRKESIHSGHFMISQFEVDEEEDEMMPQVPQDDIKMVIEPAATLGIEPAATLYNHQWRPTAIMSRRGRVKSSVIETSLTKLFECMSLAYRQKLTSPKWNRFKGIRLRWKDKIRLNNVIWRCWHMQFIIKKNALVCQFASPLDADTHNKPEAVVLEGKYWKRKLHAVTAEYKKWRQFFHLQRHEDADELADMLEWQPSSNESNSNASMLLDEDYMEFMSDTLFSTLSSQPFFFPDSKELTRVASIADFIQPSLVQLQPNLDDLMEVFEPFHDMICPKLPTVPEEQFPSPSSSLPSSLPTHLSHPAPKHRPNPNTITIIAAQSGSTQNLPKSDYLSSSSTNLAVNNLTNALAGNNISLSTGNVLKSDYRSQMSQNVVKSVDYVDKRSESLGAGQLLHHHPNIIYSSGGGAQTSGGSTLMSLTNTGAKSGAAGGRGKGGEGGYNFAMPGGEKPSVFSYAPAASASKPAPPPSYPYAGAHPHPLKAREEYPNTTGTGGYAEKPSGASGQQMYNNFDKLNIVQYNYGGKSVQYASYEKDPYKQESYQKSQESYQKPEESYQKPHESYHKTQESYQKSSVASLNQGYDKSGNSNLNQGYDKTGSSSLNQGYVKVGALHQGYGKAALNQGYDKVESASLNQVNQISGDQYGSYGAQYMQDSREEYSTSSAGGYAYHPSQQLSYAPHSSYAHNSMGSGAQYAHHLGRAQHTPPTSTGAYGYYREPSPYQQALDFKLPPPAAPTPSPASSLSSPYPSPSRRPSLGQGPPQSPEGGPCPHSPGNNLRHHRPPPGQGGPEDYALPPKPQVMKTRHRTRSSCNLVKPRYFLNTATDPNLVHHNSALLAQLLTSNSHTSYGGLPKASAVCTGETISCPGYTGRSRTPDSVYVPPPQEQVIPPAPPSYPPYPPKSAFLVSSQSEGSLFNLINSRAANFSQQNSVLQRQTRIIQEKNQQAQQRNNASASSQQQSQFNMSGASSSSSLAATSPSPSSRHPDSPPLPPTTQEPSSLSPPAPAGSSPPQSHPHPHQLLSRPAAPPYKEHRRVCHINAEQKRRCNIKNGFDTLHLLIPHLSHNPNTKMSKAAMLQKGAEYIKQLRGERAQLKEEMEALRLEVETLNAQISNSQSLLPATGAPVSRHRATRMRNMFHAHVALRSRTNWKFWLLSLICAPLLESYAGAVSGESMEELYRTTLAWSEQHCSLGNLRPIVLSALRYLSTETEILSDPSLLSEEALRAVNRPNS